MALAATLIAFAVLLPGAPRGGRRPRGRRGLQRPGERDRRRPGAAAERGADHLPPCPAQADANQDGSVTAVDAALILQFNAGLLDSLPPSGAALRVHHIDVEQGDVPLL